jgi:hypothetical protein
MCFPLSLFFWSCMYSCTCARIFIQSAWSNLCHVQVKCLFVFVPDLYFLILCYYTLVTWKFYFFDDVSCNASFHLLIAGSALFFHHLFWAVLYQVDFWQFLHVLCVLLTLQLPGAHFVISDGILLFGYISMGGHIIPEAENEHGCYGRFCKVFVSFIHIFVPFAC